MTASPPLLKLKIHLGDLTAATLLPLAEMTIESVLEIAALEFPAQFSAAAASSDTLSLFSFGTYTQLHSLCFCNDPIRHIRDSLQRNLLDSSAALPVPEAGVCQGVRSSTAFSLTRTRQCITRSDVRAAGICLAAAA